jgi:hypothetical protein
MNGAISQKAITLVIFYVSGFLSYFKFDTFSKDLVAYIIIVVEAGKSKENQKGHNHGLITFRENINLK